MNLVVEMVEMMGTMWVGGMAEKRAVVKVGWLVVGKDF